MHNRAKLIMGIIVIAALIAALLFMVRGVIRFIGNADITASEPDPMFAEPAEVVTRPPEMDALVTQKPHKTLDDYIPEVETQVDKTAEELGKEAEAKR